MARSMSAMFAQWVMALQNGRLMDRLRFEAMHDSLTGLPNRTFFHSRVRDAISHGGEVIRGILK